MSTIDVKLSYAATGETRLVSLPVQPAPTWAELVQHIQQRFALTQSPTKVTYVDDEGDEITVSSDDELRELWLGSATEPNLSLTFDASVASRVGDDEHERVRDAEQKALLDSVRDALEKDASLAHDLGKVVHDVLGPARLPHHHGHHRPYSNFASPRGRGGRTGLGGARGRHHERWEMHSRSRPLEDDASSSSGSSGTDSDMDREGAGGRRSGRGGGRRSGKHGEDCPSPPHRHFPGPPPPHPRRGHHGHHGAPMPPPPPGPPHGPPPPPFAFGFFGPPPPPPSPFPPHDHRRGMKHRPPPFFPPGPPPPPHHGPHDGAEQDPYSMAPWHALVDYFGSPRLRGPQHGRHGGAYCN
ncbi:hypothetical protein JCM9279_000064 [Rhodotorula babjevae]